MAENKTFPFKPSNTLKTLINLILKSINNLVTFL